MPAHNAKDLTGQRFERLVALDRAPTVEKRAMWRCKCDCGNEKVVWQYLLTTGGVRSCGCIRHEINKRGRNHKHDMKGTTEFRIWVQMRYRCRNPRYRFFKDYGGRGIKVCARWDSDFRNFFADMGPRPSLEYTLDRIDNDGDYEPGNCRWATRIIQQTNRRKARLFSAFGKSQTASEWGRQTGLSRNLIFMRIAKYGWPVERAVSEPAHR